VMVLVHQEVGLVMALIHRSAFVVPTDALPRGASRADQVSAPTCEAGTKEAIR
jgi:hypothetical protein